MPLTITYIRRWTLTIGVSVGPAYPSVGFVKQITFASVQNAAHQRRTWCKRARTWSWKRRSFYFTAWIE